MWQVWHGWLSLVDYTLEQMWWRLDPALRGRVHITHVHAVNGLLVVRAEAVATNVQALLDDAKEASADLCCCCGDYAVVWGPLPLCRRCI